MPAHSVRRAEAGERSDIVAANGCSRGEQASSTSPIGTARRQRNRGREQVERHHPKSANLDPKVREGCTEAPWALLPAYRNAPSLGPGAPKRALGPVARVGRAPDVRVGAMRERAHRRRQRPGLVDRIQKSTRRCRCIQSDEPKPASGHSRGERA
ncbi:hypothetical protein T492DRAFT_8607 [Pavlovales sp. CCMP2436]|nr:hypothetical protein T492DRAFT_8607 [Pavlovales sp. CCMP2436]